MIPAWATLDRDNIASLLTRGPRMPDAIEVPETAPLDEILNVPIVRATRLMLERAQANGGLVMTKGGALSRANVRALFDQTDWPDFDRETVLAVNKVLNEDDVLPILLTRMAAKEAGFLRTYKGRLLITKKGRELLDPTRAVDLFRIVFETLFWRTNLAYFDRLPDEPWPQTHIGVVLWSLLVTAHHWSTPDQLVSSCTMPQGGIIGSPDLPGFAMVTRVLRPLTWLGLMETEEARDPSTPPWRRDRRYRATSLFGRAVSFQVAVKVSGSTMH